MINPVNWAKSIYEAWFLGHPLRGFFIISLIGCIITVCIIGLFWSLGVYQYNKDNSKKKDNSLITSSVPEWQIIVSKLEIEYIDKHNARPPVEWINKRLKEEGYNFIVKLNPNPPPIKSKAVGIWVEGGSNITLENIVTEGMSKGIVLKNTKNVKAKNIKNIDP